MVSFYALLIAHEELSFENIKWKILKQFTNFKDSTIPGKPPAVIFCPAWYVTHPLVVCIDAVDAVCISW